MSTHTFLPTRQAALARLTEFLPRAGHDYAEQRNFDHGSDRPASVSGLSPYLRHRVLTEVEVLDAVLRQHSAQAAEKFIQEVCWRSYWKGWLEQRPSIWQDYLEAAASLQLHWSGSASRRAQLSRALAAQTGIACFDHWREQLQQTGYLHNHARMWFASIWIFTLHLPWQLGAALFMRELLDADPASNTLSWRWVAGLQTRGKHYLARAENIARFTQGRFDPRGQLNEAAAPMVETAELPHLQPLPQLPDADPGLRSVWLLHSEDLGIASLPVPPAVELSAAAALAATPINDRAQAAGDFVHAALDDAAQGLSARLGSACSLQPDLDSLLQWVQSSGAKQVLTAYAPVGPVADQLALLDKQLAARGVVLVRIMRNWDRCFWPHATRGFFQLKAQIPQCLAQLLGD